jgi:hypothetical protein
MKNEREKIADDLAVGNAIAVLIVGLLIGISVLIVAVLVLQQIGGIING